MSDEVASQVEDPLRLAGAVREAAYEAHASGLSVLPPRENGSKAPINVPLFDESERPLLDADSGRQRWGWDRFKTLRATDAELESWYRDGNRTGLGIVTGAVSGDVEAPEWEDAETFASYCDRAQDAGLQELLDRVLAGYLDETPGGGFRTFIRCDEIAGNLKLARRPKSAAEMKHPGDKIKTLIETRGEGGFAIVAPSHGKVHQSGKPYRRAAGGFADIATVTPEERAQLYALARSFDEMPRERERAPISPHRLAASDRPGDRFNAEADWRSLLEPYGWRFTGRRGDVEYLTRPGRDNGVSATINYAGSELLYVFTTSTAFDSERSYDKFAAYAVLEHGGDFTAAARVLAALYRTVGANKESGVRQDDKDSPEFLSGDSDVPSSGIERENLGTPAEGWTDFWVARPELQRIHDYGLAHRASPWGVLGCVLARVVAATPPNIVLPALIGDVASINLFVADAEPTHTMERWCAFGKQRSGVSNAYLRLPA